MSGYSDMIFPPSDLPAILDLPDYTDNLENSIETIPEEQGESESSDDLTVLDFNTFTTIGQEKDVNTFTTIDQENDVKVDVNCLLLNFPSTVDCSSSVCTNAHGSSLPTSFNTPSSNSKFGQLKPSSNSKLGQAGYRLVKEHMSMNAGVTGELYPFGSNQLEVTSPRNVIANELGSLSLSELETTLQFHALSDSINYSNCLPVLHLSAGGESKVNIAKQRIVSASVCSTSPLESSSLGESHLRRVQALGSSAVTIMNSTSHDSFKDITPPLGHNDSLLPPPSSTISTLEGNAYGGQISAPSDKMNIAYNGILEEEINWKSSVGHPENVCSLTDCSGVFGSRHTQQVDTVRGPIPLHVLPESEQFPLMQRSHSSHDIGKIRDLAHPLAGNEDFRLLSSPMPTAGLSSFSPYRESHLSDFQGASMRRVYSTGDLQALNGTGDNSTLSSPQHLSIEEANTRIGHYTAEERKMILHRYRQKRNERNFKKKIKYACRKTLADSRPRVKGRFAKTDDI